MLNSSKNHNQITTSGVTFTDERHVSFTTSKTTMWSIFAVVVGLLGFFIWSAFAPLDSAAIAPGVVIVESKRKPIQHFEGGIVKQILVKDGQYVELGELLLTLDESRAESSLFGLKAQWQSDLARMNRLQAELSESKTIDFDHRLLALKSDSHIDTILKTQTQLFEKRKALRHGEDQVLIEKIAQAKLDLSALIARQTADKQSLDLLSQQVAMHQKLLETGNTSKSRLLDLQREHTLLVGGLAELRVKISRAKRSITEVTLQNGNASFTYAKTIGEEIQGLERKINETREAMLNAENVLERVEIRSPQSGIVVGLNVFTPQTVITAGEKIMEIVPQDDDLIVEALVKPEDIESVTLGSDTRIRLTAYNFRKTPPISGKVTHISADRISDAETGSSAYLARVSINKEELAKLSHIQLYPGMPAEVMILLSEQTLLDYMLSPLSISAYRAMRES